MITGPPTDPPIGQFVSLSLFQVGDLPIDVKSIHFLSYQSPVELRVNGSLIPLTYTQSPGWGPSAMAFDAAGDISTFAGETVELRFTSLPPIKNGLGNLVWINGLDEITFSTIPIPEPSTLLLFSVGGLSLLAKFRARRSTCLVARTGVEVGRV